MYAFQDLKAKIYNYTKKKPFGTWQFGKIGVLVNLIIQKLKSKHLVCLSFWDISRDSWAKIYLSMEKMWALIYAACSTSFITNELVLDHEL